MKKVMMSWSSGKDSAWALYQLMQDPKVEVVGLFCSVNGKYQRAAMHAVRVELLKKQAEALSLPIDIIELPYPCSNDDYQAIMSNYHQELEQRGIEAIAFGDLFLEDVRKYREDLLANTKLEPLFPIWGTPTSILAKKLIEQGFCAILTCIDNERISKETIGKTYNKELLASLPENIDPCAENGEFHTFVYDAPHFKGPLDVKLGVVREDGRFVFIDVQMN